MRHTVARLVSYACLVYHEARNVRWLVNEGKLDNPEKYEGLRNLARNRGLAWGQMAKVRETALQVVRASDALQLFAEEYGLTLEDLTELFKHPSWRHAKLGGNKWAAICANVQKLADLLDRGEVDQANKLAQVIAQMEHNTGIVEEKLHSLENAQ